MDEQPDQQGEPEVLEDQAVQEPEHVPERILAELFKVTTRVEGFRV